MSQHEFSRIRHSSLQICSPLTDADVTDLCRKIGQLPHGRILDVGCGKSEILARIIDFTGASGLGVDLPGSLGEELSPLAARFRKAGRLSVCLQDAKEFLDHTDERFDVLVLSGASQAVGGIGDLPAVAHGLLKPKGWLVLGELAWGDKPDEEFLNILEMTEGDLPYVRDVPALIANAGFELIQWDAVPRTQFFQYEKSLLENGMAYAMNHPEDAEAKNVGVRSQDWFKLVEQYGIRSFTFGWGLFQKVA